MSDEQSRRDELVSAYLDGEATPAEIAEVEADDALLDRVEQLRAVRVAVAAPGPSLSAEQRDRMIRAALAAADEPGTKPDTESDIESGGGPRAKVVPLRRTQRMLLAVAAAAVVLAGVVGTGLIAGRGGDDKTSETAAEAPASAHVDEAGAAEMAEAPAEELMADTDAAADMAPEVTVALAEETMAAVEPMAEAETALDEPAAEAAAAAAEFDDEAEMIGSAEEGMAEMDVTTGDRRDDSAEAATDGANQATPVVDLGLFESLESLLERVEATQTESPDDGTTAAPGPCSAAVHERARELDAITIQSFAATVGGEDPVAFDARLARQADGALLIVYAAPPGCQAETHEPTGP